MERFDCRAIFLSLLGFLPFLVCLGYDHRTVHAELIVRIVNGNDAPTFSLLLGYVLERAGFDVSTSPLSIGGRKRWRRWVWG